MLPVSKAYAVMDRFCGLTRNSPSSLPVLHSEAQNWVYRYESGTKQGKWTQILRSPLVSPDSSCDVDEPQARYAHQVVFDPKRNVVFMFGGNAGLASGGGKMEHIKSGAEGAPDKGNTEDDGDTRDTEIREGESQAQVRGRDGDGDGGDDVNMEDDGKTEKGNEAEEKEQEDVMRLNDLWHLSLRR